MAQRRHPRRRIFAVCRCDRLDRGTAEATFASAGGDQRGLHRLLPVFDGIVLDVDLVARIYSGTLARPVPPIGPSVYLSSDFGHLYPAGSPVSQIRSGLGSLWRDVVAGKCWLRFQDLVQPPGRAGFGRAVCGFGLDASFDRIPFRR